MEKDIELLVKNDLEELLDAFDEIQMPRPPFVLEKMVVHGEDTEQQAYAHCVLEMSIAYDNLRIAKLNTEKAEIEIDEIDQSTRKGEIDAEIKRIELEQLRRARLGAMREFETLYNLWKQFPVKFTREQLDEAQPEYWKRRLTRQANQELIASGRVGPGNQEALRQIGASFIPQPHELPMSKIDNAEALSVNQRYLSEGNVKLVVAVPTEKQALGGLPCLDGVTFPSNCMYKILNMHGLPVHEAYNNCAFSAVEDKADYMITVEDDTFPPADAIVKLLALAKKNPDCAVGAWYPKREHPRQGAHIHLKDETREFLEDDGEIHEVYTLAMGCSIYPVSMFLAIPSPWFASTVHLSQDSFFSQLAREHGYKLLVDTSIKCKHIDRESGEVFE